METGLVIVTVLATIAAAAASWVAWRTTAEEKRRARARVAALSAAAGVDAEAVARGRARVDEAAFTPLAGSAAVDRDGALSGFASEPPPIPEPTMDRAFLGSATTGPSSALQRGLAAAAAVLALGLVVFGIVRMSGHETQAAAPAAPLELLSLRHEREGPRLSVAGLVRNPEAGTNLDWLNAVVLLFDEQGTFVTSARAPVEFSRLGAGDESPFVISLDAPQNVARYRVSFRSEDRTLPHVDWRGDAASAAAADTR